MGALLLWLKGPQFDLSGKVKPFWVRLPGGGVTIEALRHNWSLLDTQGGGAMGVGTGELSSYGP